MTDRKEIRFAMEIGAAVEVIDSGRSVRATTVNVSGSGVLLEFEESVQFLVGDLVFCDFNIAQPAENPLPCWGWGKVLRAEGRCIAVEFKAGCYQGMPAEANGVSRPA
jgi:PilZ domain